MAGATKKPGAATKRGTGKPNKTAKTYRLTASKIAAAQEILGTKTATAAIEAALDMVVFRKELVDGTAALRGLDLTAFDRD